MKKINLFGINILVALIMIISSFSTGAINSIKEDDRDGFSVFTTKFSRSPFVSHVFSAQLANIFHNFVQLFL